MKLSAAFAPTTDTPSHAAIAEQLGYHRVWVFDTPALYADVWITLARVASVTSLIGIGPGALIPSLRHVVTNATAAATLEGMAPGRVALAVGSGFTGAMALGQKPVRWAAVSEYVHQLRGLLRGEVVQVDGRDVQLRHRAGVVPARPLKIPLVVAAGGPRGALVAKEVGDGVFTSADTETGFDWSILLCQGTILGENENFSSRRVLLTSGPSAAVKYHAMYERDDPGLRDLPNAVAWIAAADAVPARQRHLHVHEGHLTELNPLDVTALTPEFAASVTLTGHAEDVAHKLRLLGHRGVTEIAFQPAGPDIPRELRAFAEAAEAAEVELAHGSRGR